MTRYTLDTTHSEVAFTVRHMMFAKVRGHFGAWQASLTYDPTEPTRSSVGVEIEAASIDTREAKRDAHLRSPDFFDAEQFPKLIFRSKRLERTGASRYDLVGDLTIRDTTREVRLAVEQAGHGKDPWGNERLGFSARGTLSRSEWGLTWNQALEAGGVLVSDKVELEVEAQVIASAGDSTSAASRELRA